MVCCVYVKHFCCSLLNSKLPKAGPKVLQSFIIVLVKEKCFAAHSFIPKLHSPMPKIHLHLKSQKYRSFYKINLKDWFNGTT